MSEIAHAMRAQKRFYVGRGTAQADVYVVSRHVVRHLRPRLCFGWGPDSAPGDIDLAFAILADVTRREPSEQVCAAFAREVLTSLPADGFVLGCEDVASWLAAAKRSAPLPPSSEQPATSLGGLPRVGSALASAMHRLRAAGRRSRTP